MVLDPFSIILLLLLAALGFIASLFLPSIIEIIRPRDRGPRRIFRIPLKRIMRHASKSTPQSVPDSIGNSRISEDLEDFSRKVGVKTRRIGNDTVRVFNSISFPPNFLIRDNVVVEGALTAGDHCVFHGSVKAKGNISIGNCVVMRGNVISRGDVDIKDEAVVGGLVHAEGSVRLGEKVFIGSSIVADGDVELYESSEVKKNIITNGVIKVLKHPTLDFPGLEDIG